MNNFTPGSRHYLTLLENVLKFVYEYVVSLFVKLNFLKVVTFVLKILLIKYVIYICFQISLS
jgi:hypothetical protein